ncbi:MAG TPA: hypothetical protein VKR78_06825 [Acidimicrobiales bacterium]|nr:hypothetical protein [Acidimicrobiales bacterium]
MAIVPFFFAGSLFPISALPSWLEAVARVVPLTHALALSRYGLDPQSGVQALHNIRAALSLGVIGLYALVAFRVAVRLFAKSGTS